MDRKLGPAGVAVLFVLATLAACGGGGGDDSAAAPPPDNSTSAPPPDNVAGFAYVANQGSDNVSAYSIDASTGTLSEVAGSPYAAGIGPESISVHPSGKFAYVANFGSAIVSGNISAYTIDASTGALSEIAGSPFAAGTLPVSITVDPSGRFAYVANFIGDFSGNVSAYTIDAGTGTLSAVAGSPFAAGLDPQSVTVDPSGRFAYVANRQSASVSAYTISAGTGTLSEIAGSPFAGGGHLAVDPSGRFAYVSNSASGNVVAYTINATSGALTRIGEFLAGVSPYRATVDPSGKFAYVANRGGNNVSAYTIQPVSGALTSVGAAVAAGTRPNSVATTRKIQ